MKRALVRITLTLLVLAASAPGCASEEGDEDVKASGNGRPREVRPPAVAGAFYPEDAEALAADVDAYLEAAPVAELPGELVALVSPHAGYVYSGSVAAHGYALLRGMSFDTVVVVAPSHRFGFRGASVYGGDGYETPLGIVDVDKGLAAAIADASDAFRYEPRAHAQEHSLEVQVPFLQRALADFRIVPIIMGEQHEGMVSALAGAIAGAIEERSSHGRVLLVASTDLSHFHQYEEAVSLDSVVLEAVGSFDPEGLLAALARGDCEACGGGPLATVMMAARALGADGSTVLDYKNSGDVTGDHSGVVGYMSAALTRAGDASDSEVLPYAGLTEEERAALLELARATIEAHLAGAPRPDIKLLTPALETACGAFVTLHKHGRLRGCIGFVQASKPLHETVREMAVQAARHDPRFPPVTADEMPDIDIEISVMSPLEVVNDVSTIEVGRDGLIVQDGVRSGLLLPQVATEYGWDRKTFLEHTCGKAGLPPDAWKSEGVTIFRFTAEVFGEKESEGDG